MRVSTGMMSSSYLNSLQDNLQRLDKVNRQINIYQDKVEKDVCYETLSEDEPTVYEFKTWMQENRLGDHDP